MLRVTSEDPEFVRMLLGEGLRRWLINLQMDDFSLEVGGSWIMLSGQDQTLDGLFILGLEALAGFKERVPRICARSSLTGFSERFVTPE